MRRPKLLALSAMVAAAWCAAPYAQQSSPSSDRPAATTDRPAPYATDKSTTDRSATGTPSRTDRDTSSRVETRSSAAGDKSAKLDRGERKFVETAAQHSMAEVETGKLAQQQASSAEVKKFAERMAADHGKTAEELKKLAQDKGIDLPGDMDRGHKRMHDRLGKITGADFDKRYMSEMVRDHEKDLKDFQKMAKDAKDPDIKAFAEKNVRVMEEHLNQARQIADATGASRGGRSNKSARATGTTPGADTSASSGANRSAEQRRRDNAPSPDSASGSSNAPATTR